VHLLTLNPCATDAPSVVTVGNFDGLHSGHQQLLELVKQQADNIGAASAVVLFELQPLEFLRPEQAPSRLMSLGEKLHGLRQLGVHRVGLVRFDSRFAKLSPEQFVQEVLLDKLRCVGVWIGDDFRFGYQRAGDFQILTQIGKVHGFSVAQAPSFLLNGRRLSSTWLRETLAQADMEQAMQLLGRPYSIRGRVVHGQKLGRTIGFPTLNIVFRQKPAVLGVFAVRIHGLDGRVLTGVANIGQRPTLDGQQHRLEVHVFDWQGDVYGARVTIELCHRLRHEKKFDGIEALKAQIRQDVNDAKAWYATQL
jgi:riboflavin kinase/FMN adenylyltransferase